jgi:hypothetical protein
MEIKAIVKTHLIKMGYDGLYQNGECGCKIDDLMPCVEIRSDCQAGFIVPCDCEMNCDFHIGKEKAE